MQILREAIRGTESRSEIGTQHERRREFIFHGKARIEGELMKMGLRKSAIKYCCARLILLTRVMTVESQTGHYR